MNIFSKACKRIADIVLIILFSPLILTITIVISILVFIFDGKPILFRQERAGQHNQPFTLYKFRTMRSDTDPFGASPKSGKDSRLTRMGRFLRALSLDELPQLWNVLKGDMSLVGPRPLYMAQAQEWDDRQKRRLNVKPGITGLAQTAGRASLTIEDKLELDVQYADQQSLWLDAKIILLTLVHLVWPSNIYEKRYSKDQETRHPDGKS